MEAKTHIDRGEIRNITDRKDRRFRDQEQSDRRNQSILRKEREYEYHRWKLKEAVRQFQNSIEKSITDGRLVVIPRLMQTSIRIAKGWTLKLIYVDKSKDIFHAKGKKGFVLPMHSHPNMETIHIISGVLKLTVETNVIILNEGSSYTIMKNLNHECEPLEDCEITVTFKPPLSETITV